MQKSLFDIEKTKRTIDADLQLIKSKAYRRREKAKAKIGKAMQSLSEVIGELAMGETIHYVSMGEWSTHNLLEHCLLQTGPANVYIATWSVSEDGVRHIINAVKSGLITRIHAIFDWRVKIRRPEAFELARFNIADVRLTTCHAKVTVVQNQTWSIAIIGSANYTNNPRIEAGVICCCHDVANFHRDWMMAEIKKADPFETYKRRK